MKRVLYGGAFDIFHWMHLESIRMAKAQGDYLIVMVNSDSLCEKYKGKKPLFTETERADIIRNLKLVDEVIIKQDFEDIPYLKAYNIDVFVVCEEWEKDKQAEKEYMESKGGKAVFLPYVKSWALPDVKEKFRQLMADKGKVLCEKCHKEM